MKLCKNCKHSRWEWYRGLYYCDGRDVWETDPVAGERWLVKKERCSYERHPSQACGLDAKFFELKKPWWRFW